MGFNYWGIFFFVMPIIVSVLVGSVTLMMVSIKGINSLRRFKRRRF
ncbi:hypothetical protein [Clostridium saudiense]|nr:hypothetical protein [Clostridium saudiense]